jgi:hypothetical protein
MRELIDLLIRSKIPLLVIGGHAVGVHSVQRDTIDVDCIVAAERREEMKLFLESRGFDEAARHGGFSRFHHRSLIYPLLDVMEVDAETWREMWDQSVAKTLVGLPVRVPAVGHLISLKLHAIQQNPSRTMKDGEDLASIVRANPDVMPEEELRQLFGRYQQLSLYDMIRNTL